MFLDTRNNQQTIIMNVPFHHVFIASSELDEPIADGCSTGDFPHYDTAYHLAEGFIPLTEARPDFDDRYQQLTVGDITISEDGKSAIREWVIVDIDILSLKNSRISEVSAMRKSLEKTAVSYTFAGVDYLLHADDKTFSNITGFLKRLAINGTVTANNWYFDDGKFLLVNATQATAMLNIVADRQQALRDAAATYITAINALSTPLSVVEYDFTTGW